jgi:hypothetical protein
MTARAVTEGKGEHTQEKMGDVYSFPIRYPPKKDIVSLHLSHRDQDFPFSSDRPVSLNCSLFFFFFFPFRNEKTIFNASAVEPDLDGVSFRCAMRCDMIRYNTIFDHGVEADAMRSDTTVDRTGGMEA